MIFHVACGLIEVRHMTKTKQTKKHRPSPRGRAGLVKKEADSSYFLKLLLYFILGTLWVRLLNIEVGPFQHLSLPLGLVVGLWFASHDKFQIDRKIEYAVLLVATFLSFYLPVGVTI